ncbi:MAG TPA: PAS domain S-box protein [Anaerolineales bacterium]
METDRKTKAARNPAKSKKIHPAPNGNDTGKKPDRAIARPKTSKGRPPGIQKVTRRAQEELIGTQQRLLATYEHAPIGIIECSPDSRLVNVNKEFCHITGYDKEELLALSLKDLTYEEDYVFDIKMHQRLIAGEIPYYKLEKRYLRKDGQIIWVELTRNVVRDSNGKALFTIGVALDVTDRKLAEEALQLARDQAERTADRITRLQKVTAALSEALTPSQVAEIVVEQGAPALGAVSGTMMLAEDDQTLEIVHSASPEAITRLYQRFSISLKIPAADAARSGQPVWIESRQQYLERYPHLADQIAVWSHQAAVAIPMVDKGRTLGVLALSFDRILAYTPEDQDYAVTLARQGAQALERARLYEAEQQARHAVTEFAQRQEVLYRLADQLHHTRSFEDIFHSALDAILSALQCDRASILLLDDTEVMRFVAWRGLSDGYRQATEGHSPWKADAKDPEPISINDIGTAEISESLKATIKREGIGSLAFIPLVSNGELIGKFMAYFNAPHVFSGDELDLSLTIARQLAFGIERKRAEEKLRESEEKYRTLFNSIDDGFCIIEKLESRAGEPLDFRYLVTNPAFAAQSGVGDVVGKTIRQAFPGEPEEWFETYDTILRTGEAIRFERELVTQGRVLELYAFRVEDEMHRRIAVIFKDITERKQAEEKILFQANLLGAVASAVIATDLNGIVLYWNPAAEKLYGWPASDALGKNIVEVAPAPQSQERAQEIMQQLAGGNSWSGEFLVQRRDGSTFPAFVSDSPILDSNGKLVGIIGVSSDITNLKQAEEALQQLNLQLENRVHRRTAKLQATNQALREEIAERQQAEELLRRWAHIFENADWGIATVHQDTFTMVNPTYAKMHGYTANELVGRSIYDVYAPETHAHAREQIRITYETGHHFYESRHVRKDGSVFPVLVDTTVVRDEAGNALYRAVNAQDITERKHMERALHESHRKLQLLSRRLVEVQENERRALARDLHDRVGQTLAALNINLIIMNSQLLDDSKQRIGSRLDDSMRLTAEAIALVRNVMTDLRPAVLDDYGLEAALQSYIDDYTARYGIEASLDRSDQPIPRLEPGLEMTLLRIGQEALTNVARHAQTRHVRAALRVVDHSICLTVEDDGVGMASLQAATGPTNHGVRIMRERAEAFGGSVEIESAPGEGTKVKVRIPIEAGTEKKSQEET